MKSLILQLAAHVLVISAMSASAAIRYVNVNSTSPAPPYTNWTSAAAHIQDAVDAALAGEQILVTNGVYQTGGIAVLGITNRVTVNKPVTVQSINGAAVTLIAGDGVVRCVYLANEATLVGFTLTNGVADHGGGVRCESASATVSNCVLTGNSAWLGGGGAASGTLHNCTLTGNSAQGDGGGAYVSLLNNCMLTGNSATESGGGAARGTLNNCTLTANSADLEGGGVSGATVNNCIVYYNNAASRDNYSDSSLNYSCATPLPSDGVGNLSAEPLLADLSHLSAASPCRQAGSAAFASGLDTDGETWASPPAIGCDQYRPGAATGPLSVSIQASFTNVFPGIVVDFKAAIDGHAAASQWDFGDGTVVSNRPYVSHSWAVAGDYMVVLQASNDTSPAGTSATVIVRVVARTMHHVALDSSNPVAPYASWATAATTIQDAIDAAVAGDHVLVTNGVYQTGGNKVFGIGTMNRVAVDKPVTVQSVNGPAVTLIQGGQGIRCVYLTNGAALVGFTLTNGAADYGGGVWCGSVGGVVSNCVLTGNRATDPAGMGGGATGGTLNNCTLAGNSAWGGGGTAYSTLNNCTLTGNAARGSGGGADGCTLNNCVVYYNTASIGPNYSDSSLNHSCTTPLPPEGVGNISAEPQLTDSSHLSAGSPCRAAGSATYATGLDMDGEAWANPPSIGTDEYYPGAVAGPLSVTIQAAYTNVAVGFAVDFTAAIEGRATVNRWELGTGTVVSNRPYASHSWVLPGDYPVVFQAHNDTYPGGVSAIVTVHVVAQPVHYVALGSANPVAPYTSWATAATNIQDVVDAASVAGALVMVTNGVYQTGGRVVPEFGGNTNRVAVTKALLVRSVNGAAVTVIQGDRGRYANDSQAGLRCVYLANGAVLAGFTLTQGAASFGGGIWCESASAVVSNCVLTENRANGAYGAFGTGGGAYGGTLSNSTLTSNSASFGGGTYGANLNHCTLSGNHAYRGGGAIGGTLNNCTLTGNSTPFYGLDGGGAAGCTLNNCTLSGNTAYEGGGAASSTLNNCTLTGNSAEGGGGAAYSTLHNCTLSANSAGGGGGALGGTLDNCIVYYNSSSIGANYDRATLSYSCTTPLPTNGLGNVTSVPLFVDDTGGNFRLQRGSPCIDAGANALAADGPDLDGNPRIVGGTVDMGAYEFGSPLPPPPPVSPTRYVNVNSASPAPPYTNWTTAAANIQDAVDAAAPGDLILVTNGVYQTGGRLVSNIETTNRVAVTQALIVRSVNGAAVTFIQGWQAPEMAWTDNRTRCVYLADGATLAGFTLTNGIARSGGGVWCESPGAIVSDCVLTANSADLEGGGAWSGTLNNCMLRGNSTHSGNSGGGGAINCMLNYCTVTANSVIESGGGALYCTLNNCTLSGNSALYAGGGAFNCTLNNCALSANSAGDGGGAFDSTLNNCTLIANTAIGSGGGAHAGTLNNCIVYYNSAPNGANYDSATLSYSCTTPLPTNGFSNFTNAPLFVDYDGGDLRLQPDSPCINAGSNAFAPGRLDLDGNWRLSGGTVDLGAYEFQSPETSISYYWLEQFSFPKDGSQDYDDPDGDGLTNWQEWRAGTDPTNASSALRLLSATPGPQGVIVRWQSVSGLKYLLERAIDLGAEFPFLPLASDVAGQSGTTTFTDTTAAGTGPFFYRVGVQE